MSKSPLRLTVKIALVRAFDDRGKDVAVCVEASFGDDDQAALEPAAGRRVGDGLEAAVLPELFGRHQEVEGSELRAFMGRVELELRRCDGCARSRRWRDRP